MTTTAPGSSGLEATLRHDLEHIRRRVLEMGTLAESVLKLGLQALTDRDRQKAYAVILRDRRIDEMEQEIDRLCLEFLVRQQPVAGHLRFVYATIKVNAELERIGDYAESIARQILKIASLETLPAIDRFVEIANMSIPMLHASVEAFLNQDAELARRTMLIEDRVDGLRAEMNGILLKAEHDGLVPLEALTPLLTIVRRYERVSDQAKNICEEALYVSTGQSVKHRDNEALRVLFVDEHNATRSLMAEGIGKSMGMPQFEFIGAGLDPGPPDAAVIRFLQTKGIDMSGHSPLGVAAISDLNRTPVIVALSSSARRVFPPPPTKCVALDWSRAERPVQKDSTPAEVDANYEQAFQQIRMQIQDLVQALLGEK